MKKYLLSLFAPVMAFALLLSVSTAANGADEQDLIQGAKKEGEVVIWTHVWERGLTDNFKKKYPFLKVTVWDGRNETVVNRIITEGKAGRHSVDTVILVDRGLIALKSAGFLREYNWPKRVKEWPHQTKHNYWAYFNGTGFVPTYNPNLVSSNEVPKSWDDLKNPKWKGKSIISVSGAQAPLLFAYLWRRPDGALNWDKTFSFWKEVIKTDEPNVSRGFNQPTELVSAGEYQLLLYNSLNVALRYMAEGAKLKLVPVGKLIASGLGVAMPKTVPHPNAAQLFINFLTSPEGVLRYADLHYTIVLDPEVAKKAKSNRIMTEMGITAELIPDEFITDENLKKATSAWLSTLGVKRTRRRR